MTRLALLIVALLIPSAAAAGHSISGQVLDRNGEPIQRAVVSLAPGSVQLVTDQDGRFLIDYLRDDEGKRSKLKKRTMYALEVFKPGYHVHALSVDYKRGEVVLQAFTLTEETITVEDMDDNLDPGLFQDSSHNSGANYEGQ